MSHNNKIYTTLTQWARNNMRIIVGSQEQNNLMFQVVVNYDNNNNKWHQFRHSLGLLLKLPLTTECWHFQKEKKTQKL